MENLTLSNATTIIWYSVISLCGLFPFLALFGFFENRKEGAYRFRSGRFLTVVFCLIVLNLSVSIVADYGVANLLFDGSKVAEPAVLSNRAIAEYRIQSEAVMFPEVLTDQKISCYRVALSNYIEDQWNGYVHEESCKSANHICVNNETDYYDALLKTFDNQTIENDMHAISIVLGSIWVTAADMYNLTRRLQRAPDGKGHVPDPPDEKMLANYNRYFDSCASLKPLPWAVPGEELMVVHPYLCFGRCP